MVTKRNDRRVFRTRNALKQALLALILEKGYDGVTIEDITDQADLGRTTFYLHYRDKEDLLLESIRTLIDDLVDHIRASQEQPILLAFQHAADNADLYRVILRGEGAYKAIERLRRTIIQTIESLFEEYLRGLPIQDQHKIEAAIPMEAFTNYFAGSLLGFMTWWLEEEKPYSPQEMTDMFSLMFFNGGRELLGMEI